VCQDGLKYSNIEIETSGGIGLNISSTYKYRIYL